MNKYHYRRYFVNVVGVAALALPISNPILSEISTALSTRFINGSVLASGANIAGATESEQEKSPQQETMISIKAVGDIVAGTNFPDNRLPKNPDSLFPQPVQKKLQGADILFGNYESTLTNHPHSSKDVSRGNTFAFRSPPSYGKLFNQVGFDIMSIANNHSMDFGVKGFKDTVASLKNAGVTPIGEKNRIVYTRTKGVDIAWIGFCFYEYCNTVQNIQAATNLVKQAQQKADIVIISMHVGAEGNDALHVKNQTEIFYGENRGNSLHFARKMVDVGADLVLGHGPHVPRGMEVYKNKLIAYSLGNFLGYRTFSTKGNKGKSLILEAKINQKGDFVSGQIIPLKLNRQGIPQIDPANHTTVLVNQLSKNNFPNNQIAVDKKGQIRLINEDMAKQ